MSWLGVDVKTDVHVASRQVDDEVRVVIHWRRRRRRGRKTRRWRRRIPSKGEGKNNIFLLWSHWEPVFQPGYRLCVHLTLAQLLH